MLGSELKLVYPIGQVFILQSYYLEMYLSKLLVFSSSGIVKQKLLNLYSFKLYLALIDSLYYLVIILSIYTTPLGQNYLRLPGFFQMLKSSKKQVHLVWFLELQQQVCPTFSLCLDISNSSFVLLSVVEFIKVSLNLSTISVLVDSLKGVLLFLRQSFSYVSILSISNIFLFLRIVLNFRNLRQAYFIGRLFFIDVPDYIGFNYLLDYAVDWE